MNYECACASNARSNSENGSAIKVVPILALPSSIWIYETSECTYNVLPWCKDGTRLSRKKNLFTKGQSEGVERTEHSSRQPSIVGATMIGLP
jgi:hypothetical protein